MTEQGKSILNIKGIRTDRWLVHVMPSMLLERGYNISIITAILQCIYSEFSSEDISNKHLEYHYDMYMRYGEKVRSSLLAPFFVSTHTHRDVEHLQEQILAGSGRRPTASPNTPSGFLGIRKRR